MNSMFERSDVERRLRRLILGWARSSVSVRSAAAVLAALVGRPELAGPIDDARALIAASGDGDLARRLDQVLEELDGAVRLGRESMPPA